MTEINLGDMLSIHLSQCGTCIDATKATPVRFGDKSGYCREWFDIIQEYADFEGMANNLTPPAQRSGQLDRRNSV